MTLPRWEVAMRDEVRKLTLANDKAEAVLPLGVSQKKLALAKQKQDLDKSREQLAKLSQDRGLMTLVAPADGIVFYGRPIYGEFPSEPHSQILQKMVIGGSLSPEEVVMTVVAPRPAAPFMPRSTRRTCTRSSPDRPAM